ncbi:growth arrest and DNA damage-inducible protein GADD45 gamma-like [Ostrea edulis]|uniref:growth arrest and DNA damage-inducible protein GADD45 gamma-like n=1 Tax=Ostrea edulis TaxID=37623 RepID=UPI0020941E2A|nr:growth arrest and DNA damage-inducible protein GADD45 gamma-like [Ostrea edulis]
MTFTENSESTMQSEKRTANTGQMLKDVLVQAKEEGRATFGIYECAQLLNTNSDDVTLCILPPGDVNDVTVHIHHTLMEAFCLENDIKLIKVDSLEKLEAVFSGTSNTDMLDCSCVLVTAPEKTDHTYNDLMDVTDGPVIEMPV